MKEKYYPVRSYEEKYIQWNTLQQQRDQDVHEPTNLFHTMSIMVFLDISSLSVAYWYAAKIEKNVKEKK